MNEPLVSVVVVTWNRQTDILETVQSIYDQEYCHVEIIVVDNGSTDDTLAEVRARYPAVHLVALEQNLGASAGRNAGIAQAHGEIVFFLDSDASLCSDTLTHVITQFQREPTLGGLACKVVNASTHQLDRVAGWIFSEGVKARQDEPFLSFGVSECGSAFRKAALDQAGGFWEYLFFGREGEELCLRVWDEGYQIRYLPLAKVYHRVSPQKRVEGSNRERTQIRNMLAVYIVRYRWWMLLIFLPLKLFSSFVRGLGRRDTATVLRAYRDLLADLPMLLRERRPIKPATARIYMRLQRDHGALSWNIATWLRYKANLSLRKLPGASSISQPE